MFLYRNNTKWQNFFYVCLILMLIGFIIILGSTTGYAGLVLLILILAYLHLRYRRFQNRLAVKNNLNFFTLFFLFGFLIVIPVCIIFYNQISFFINFLVINHIGKIEGDAGSGALRYNTNLIALNVFLKSPFFGVGYGHNRSTTYFTLLLSNVGIIGFFLLNYFMLYLIVMPLTKLKAMRNDLRLHAIIFVTMFIISYIINFAFSGDVAIAFGWLWTNAAILSRINNWKKLETREALIKERVNK